MKTEDEVLYRYQRKLWTSLQWSIISGAPIGIMLAAAVVGGLGMVKKRGAFDVPLFGMPAFMFYALAKKYQHQTAMFATGYPAHPEIIEARRKCLNGSCYFAPSMLKNEIEYMHGKIEGVDPDDEAA